MKFRRILANTIVATMMFLLLSAPMASNVSAEPFKDITIIDGVTTIEADWFDSGEENYEEQNASEGDHTSRPGELPQTQQTAGYYGRDDVDEDNNYCIGWIYDGEWVQYTVNVEIDGSYKFEAWIATDSGTPGGVELSCDGVKIGESEEPEADGWQDYTLYDVGVIDMAAGTRVIKCLFLGGMNLDAIIVTRLGDFGTKEPWKPKNFVIGSSKTTITAVDFDSGQYGKAPADGSKEWRPDEEVNTQFGESEFGGNIGWIAAGDWVQYTVTVQRDGVYNFEAWLASDADEPGGVTISVDGNEVGTSPSADKNGWQAYSLYSAGEAAITAGEHVIKVEFTGGLNISALEVTRTGSIPEEEPETPAAVDDDAADDVAGNDDGTTESNTATDEEGGGNTLLIIIIAVALVAVVVVVLIIVTAKGKKKADKE